MYADTWLGFSEVELRAFLEEAGFEKVESWIVDREKQTPAFETILAIGSDGLVRNLSVNGTKSKVPMYSDWLRCVSWDEGTEVRQHAAHGFRIRELFFGCAKYNSDNDENR